MKLFYPKKLILAACIALGFIGCKEDDTDVPLTVANIAGTYKLTDLTQSTSVTAATSIYAQYIETCHQDDTYEFKTDSTATYTDAGVTCSTPAAHYDFSWELINKAITIEDLELTSSVEFTGGEVKKFDGHTLIIAGHFSGVGAITITATFTKQ